VIDGIGFNTIFFPDGTSYASQWRDLVGGLLFDGSTVDSPSGTYENAVVTVLSLDLLWSQALTGLPTAPGGSAVGYQPAIDGFTIQGGDQLDFPTNLNDNGGGPVPNPVGDFDFEAPVIQGGGIFVNAYARNLQITNNQLRSNGGTYGGAIRVGTPYVGDNQNDHVRILRNRIVANGGTNLAGAVALFNGSEDYQISRNQLCGNFSAEYGGGISHFGFSPNSSIDHNQITFNGSYDEGAGIMVAGELPNTPDVVLPQGSGPVNIDKNLIQANLANDDGGGLRFLVAGNHLINVRNNMIVDNISTHEGGGIALDDSTNVRIVNNTIMGSITTATAATSTGAPMPAGLSDVSNSELLQASLPAGHASFSDPLLFNNIFWDNRAGTWDNASGTIGGIGLPGDNCPLPAGPPCPINYWDVGVSGGGGSLTVAYSLLQESPNPAHPFVDAGGNHFGFDPNVLDPRPVTVGAFPWRGDPQFIGTITIVLDPNADPNATLLGDYHLGPSVGGPINGGTPSRPYYGSPPNVPAPTTDFDDQARPQGVAFDIGADEVPAALLAESGATFTPLTPTRVLDTRSGNGLSGAFSANTPRTFQVGGRGGVPVDAIAVTGNLTVTNQTSAGYVYLGPNPTASPTSSTLNFPLADTRANGVTVALNATGNLSATFVAPAGRTTQLTFDVTGYFLPGDAGATFVPVTPARLLDSRVGNGLSGLFAANSPRTFQVSGRAGVPASAVAVTGNLTVTGQSAAGYAYLGPNAQSSPTSSTLNFPLGDTRANGVTVALSPLGRLSATYVAPAGRTTHFVFDVTGYFLPDGSGATYVALTPTRLLDTRVGNGLSGVFTSSAPRTVGINARYGLPYDAMAVTGNLTVTNQTAAGFVYLGPDATTSPTSSTLNFPIGDTRANGVTVAVSTLGRLSATYGAPSGKTTHLVFDVTGYFADATP
jgi:hypothetical protein